MGTVESQHITIENESFKMPPRMQFHSWRRICTCCYSRYVTTELMLKHGTKFTDMDKITTCVKGGKINRIIPKNIKTLIEEMKKDLTRKYPEASWEIDLSLHLDLSTEKEYGVLYGYTYLCDCCITEFRKVHFSSERIWNDTKHGEYTWETPVIDFSNYQN